MGKDVPLPPGAASTIRRGVAALPLAAVVSTAAFLVSYGYERGYADYFGIPDGLVQIKPDSIVPALLGIGLAAALATMAANVLAVALKRKREDTPKSLYFRHAAVFFCVLGIFNLWLNPLQWQVPAIQVVGATFLWWSSRRAMESGAWLTWSESKGIPRPAENPIDAPNPPWDGRFLAVWAIFLALTGLHSAGERAGTSRARQQTEFWTVELDGRAYVALRQYGDVLVLGALAEDGSVGRDYVALPLGAQELGLTMTRARLNPLVVPLDHENE